MSSEPAGRRILADVNVWLATVVEAHPHHSWARAWWRDDVLPSGARVYFCRVTQLGFLRLLCHAAVMGSAQRQPDEAWRDYATILAQKPVGFLAEPKRTGSVLHQLTAGMHGSGGLWTDAYLASLALTAGLDLATFDRGYRRFAGDLTVDLLA